MENKKNKSIVGGLLVVLVVILAVIIFDVKVMMDKESVQPAVATVDTTLIGESIVVRRATAEGNKMTNAYVSVPYTRDSSDYAFMNVALDLNKDGVIAPYAAGEETQEEWIIQNMPARILAAEGNSFSFQLYDETVEERNDFPLSAMLTAKTVEKWTGEPTKPSAATRINVAAVEQDEVRPRFSPALDGLGSGGFPADLFAANYAFARESEIPDAPPANYRGRELSGAEDGTGAGAEGAGGAAAPSFNQFHSGLPDKLQGRNECVPTSVANSIMWMKDEYNFNDLNLNMDQIIAELKTDFHWTADNGVNVPRYFLAGKRAFTTRHSLPIVTHQVGGRFDTGIVAKIAEELKKGQDVEIDMEYGLYDSPTSYRRVGGHMVTVVGAWTAGESQFLDMHDPLSPGPGTLDIYKIDGTRVVNYRYQGRTVTYIRFAIAESPLPHEAEETVVDPDGGDTAVTPETGGTAAAPEPSPEPKEKIKVISIPQGYVTVDQIKKYTPAECPACDADHWHAIAGTVKTVDGKTVTDPFSNCGLGKTSEHPVMEIEK